MPRKPGEPAPTVSEAMNDEHTVEFLIMRHGQSVADVEDRFEGQADFSLTERGREQAGLAAEWIKANCPPRRIVSSPLARAKETAEIIAGVVDVPVECEPELMERNNASSAESVGRIRLWQAA